MFLGNTKDLAVEHGADAGIAAAGAPGQQGLLTEKVTGIERGNGDIPATGFGPDHDFDAALDDHVHAVAEFRLADDELFARIGLYVVFRCLQNRLQFIIIQRLEDRYFPQRAKNRRRFGLGHHDGGSLVASLTRFGYMLPPIVAESAPVQQMAVPLLRATAQTEWIPVAVSCWPPCAGSDPVRTDD